MHCMYICFVVLCVSVCVWCTLTKKARNKHSLKVKYKTTAAKIHITSSIARANIKKLGSRITFTIYSLVSCSALEMVYFICNCVVKLRKGWIPIKNIVSDIHISLS